MSFARASGILLHPTSLPNRYGVGDIGPEAYAFADFLEAGGQQLWQVLPLGPTGYGDSPYACYSAFAGNPLLVSPDKLFEEGLLTRRELNDVPTLPADRVDFESVHSAKDAVLRQAFEHYRHSTDTGLRSAVATFVAENTSWLDGYALFRALKTAHDGVAWTEWEPAFVQRDPIALSQALSKLQTDVDAHKFFQFLFFKQWFELKAYCNKRGISLIGDIPIFVAQDSADVWTNPDQFKLDPNGRPLVVAGVPPDYFSATGQYWGNPIYNWDRMLADGFRWWIERVRASLQIVDIARVDHFRGFAACWEIPGGDSTAERGRWVEAPGKELFTAIRRSFAQLPIIAEDLGVITPDVEKLRDDFDLPGMRILQFAFSSDTTNHDLPHNYHRNVAVYTGTHDNDTTVGWFNSVAGEGSTRTAQQIKKERECCMRYLDTAGSEIHWDLIRAVLASVANTAIVPLQDLLGLGTEARMNLPNSTKGNWTWRFKQGDLTDKHGARLREMTDTYGRLSRPEIETIKLD